MLQIGLVLLSVVHLVEFGLQVVVLLLLLLHNFLVVPGGLEEVVSQSCDVQVLKQYCLVILLELRH